MKTRIMILTMILAFASLYATDTLYSAMNDRAEEFSQNQSDVFSPGYINAAKQRTEAIIRQESKPKTLMENVMEYVKNKLSNRVAEGANDEVAPELKKKTGGLGDNSTAKAGAVQSEEISVDAAEDVSPDEIPAYMRNSIQEYCNENGVVPSQIKSAGEKYYAFWSEKDSNNHSSVKTQVFDSNGKALLSAPTSLTGDRVLNSVGISNITTLGNGNLAVFWSETDSSSRKSLKTQVFDSSRNTLLSTPTSLTGDRVLNSVGISNITTLGNGNLAVCWYENGSRYWSLKTQVFDSRGNTPLSAQTSLTGDRILSDVMMYDVTTLKNGNLAVFWKEYDSSWCASLKTQVFDSSGNTLLSAPISLTGDRILNGGRVDKVITLGNGNLAVFWDEYDSNSRSSIKAQVFDSNGNTLLSAPASLTGDRILNSGYVENVTILGNGNLAVFWNERNLSSNWSLRTQVFDSIGNTLFSTPISLTGDRIIKSGMIPNIIMLKNGNLAVFWHERDSSSRSSFKAQVFDSSGNTLLSAPISLTGGRILKGGSVDKVITLGNGNLAVFWTETDSNSRYSIKAQVFDSNGKTLLSAPISLTENRILEYGVISNITMLEDGNLAVFWSETDSNSRIFMKTQVLDANGILAPITSLRPPTPALETILGGFGSNTMFNARLLPDPKMALMSQNVISQAFSDLSKPSTFMDSNKASCIFKGLLSNKDMLAKDAATPIDQAMLAKIVRDALSTSALSLPAGEINPQEMRLAMVLANILTNPTEDQKMILDAVMSLLNEVNKQEEGAGSPELQKALDNLLQMAASVLIAQAIPDLLKEGDIANVKNIFAELNTNKSRIILEYQELTKPYYDNIVKELSKNMQLLQLKNVLSNNMTREELEKLTRSELDKIMDMLRNASNKSFEEEYILQEEAKYRKAYIDPSKKALEDSLKKMLDGFTKRLSGVLEDVKRTEKK